MSETLGEYKDYTPRPPRVGTEIDYRKNHGVEVFLYWDDATNEVWVGVVDDTTGEVFNIDIPPGVKPTEVFNHPYAYRGNA
jgi:hypothetical protein